jgi:hypothetical protein
MVWSHAATVLLSQEAEARAAGMLRFTERQRAVFADKVSDLGNVAGGLFVFGQFVSDVPASPLLLGVGVLVWLALLALALFVAEGG